LSQSQQITFDFNRYLGAFITLSPEMCFVVEDDNEVLVGFVGASADARDIQRRIRVAWYPELQGKYPDLFQWDHSDQGARIPAALKVLH
jgi:hypothetical protein